MHLIFNYKVTNISGEQRTQWSLGTVTATLPHELAVKLVDILGHNAGEAIPTATIITPICAYRYDNANGDYVTPINATLFNEIGANVIRFTLSDSSGVTFDVDESKYFEGRVALTLF